MQNKAPKALKDAVFALWAIGIAALAVIAFSACQAPDLSPQGHRSALPAVYEGAGIQG